jgi:hypothetical protein
MRGSGPDTSEHAAASITAAVAAIRPLALFLMGASLMGRLELLVRRYYNSFRRG